MSKEHILVALDRTLAHYDKPRGALEIGAPIPSMVKRVQQWLADDIEVKIFTARISIADKELRASIITVIQLWCDEHIGVALDVVNYKTEDTLEIWDTRAVQVKPNTGEPVNKRAVGFAAGESVPR